MPSVQARRFALTFFRKPTKDYDDTLCTYFVSGEETCPETKRVHWQSYAELSKKLSIKAVKFLFGDNTVHVEKCKGNAKQNIEYCKKDGNIYCEQGKPKQAGKRTDLIALREHYKSGKRTRQAIEDDGMLITVSKCPKLVNLLALMYTPERTEMTELHILWGPTSTGKSHTAYEESKALGEVYFKPTGKWWDGYDNQPCVIFEDFRGEIPLCQMLRICDKYPLRVQVKGGFKQFTSKRVYITSNLDVDEMWNSEQKGYSKSIAALKRRITSNRHLAIKYIPMLLDEN